MSRRSLGQHTLDFTGTIGIHRHRHRYHRRTMGYLEISVRGICEASGGGITPRGAITSGEDISEGGWCFGGGIYVHGHHRCHRIISPITLCADMAGKLTFIGKASRAIWTGIQCTTRCRCRLFFFCFFCFIPPPP